jgi:small subunit ribosomal protein S14
MAKKSMIEREKKRVRETNKYESKRKLLLEQFHSKNDYDLKLKTHCEIQKLPRNSAKVRIRRRCWKTGRSRGYYRDFGLSRHVLREMAHQCLLPGVTKSSW